MTDRPCVLKAAGLLRRLADLELAGRKASAEADGIRDELDALSGEMTRLEYDRLRLYFVAMVEGCG